MTVPDRLPSEAVVTAGEESTVSVSETAVAGPAFAVTPADPALDSRLAIGITGLPPGTLVRLDAHQLDGGGRPWSSWLEAIVPDAESLKPLSHRTRRGGSARSSGGS
jgi:hypothetical protein